MVAQQTGVIQINADAELDAILDINAFYDELAKVTTQDFISRRMNHAKSPPKLGLHDFPNLQVWMGMNLHASV